MKKRLVEVPQSHSPKKRSLSQFIFISLSAAGGEPLGHDGKFLAVESWMEGGVGIYDLESDLGACIGTARSTVFTTIYPEEHYAGWIYR